MRQSFAGAFTGNFLGKAPNWYKIAIVAFLVLNPVVYFINPFAAGWLLVLEFIFTLALALKCYPLPAGGLLAVEAVVIGMTSPASVYHEVAENLPVILLLMFMVAGIYFMKEGILFMFTRLLVSIKSKVVLSLVFCFMGAFLSAFLDALTVTAVIISVAYGFYAIYYKFAAVVDDAEVSAGNEGLKNEAKADMDQFRGFLRNILMHAAVGTALGGAMTLVGEPQNLLIGRVMEWHFGDFFLYCSPVSVPVAIVGLLLCVVLELIKFPGYGYKLPDSVRKVLEDDVAKKNKMMDKATIARLMVQALVGVLLIMSLALHLAEVGLIGLMVIILLTAFQGKINEHDFAPAFEEGLPFTALLVVFFSIVAVIHDQHLFKPVIDIVLGIEGRNQLLAMFMANGVLSMISDNVFVATVYITEVQEAFKAGMFDAVWYNKLAVAVNMGTNIPSVATPNGQAAFLFLLTSALAPLIRLSYMEMVRLALPYAVVLTGTGLAAVYLFL